MEMDKLHKYHEIYTKLWKVFKADVLAVMNDPEALDEEMIGHYTEIEFQNKGSEYWMFAGKLGSSLAGELEHIRRTALGMDGWE